MPVNYDDLFGGGAMAAHFALQDREQERERAQGQIRQQELANLFAEQNNPLLVQQNQLRVEDLGYKNKQIQQQMLQDEQLAPLKLDDEKKKFILSAKRSDLDLMQLEAQRMAYSPDKATSEEGQRLLMLHRDFIKLREQGDQKRELVDQRGAVAERLEGIKQANRLGLNSARAAKTSQTTPTESKVLAPLLQQALTLQQSGDTEGANRALALYQVAKQAQAIGRSDPNAGKPTITPDGTIGTIQPKAPVQFDGTPATPTQKAQHTLAQVMQMYPGRSAEEIKAAYKKKTGVDLK